MSNSWFSDFYFGFQKKWNYFLENRLAVNVDRLTGWKNNWFSEISEMIFIFLENENGLLKSLPEMMFGG